MWEQPSKQETFLTAETVIAELSQAIDEMKFADKLTGEVNIRYGNEMIDLYSGIRTALDWSKISQIADFRVLTVPADAPLLFPETLVTALADMDEIAQTIAAFNQASNQVTRQRELLKANEKLLFLEDQAGKVPKPIGPLLSLVIAHWQRLLAAGSGELPRAQSLEPVSNPYVIANPVIGDLFVGREDKLNRLEELWGGTGQKPSVVLFGNRRVGKTSILNNLGSRFGANTIIVDFNMQREGIVANTGELLYNLTMAIYDTIPPSMQEKLEHGEPDEEQFTNHNPHTAFNRFLKRLDRAREHTRFIVTVDEFELLEDLIDKGKADPKLLDHWRSLIQTYPWFVMALAGLHTLREMTHDYWHPLYSSVIAEPVSFLSPGAARKLITQPTPEFPLDYDADAIERIIAITNGQPYLIQLICHGLVTRFNRQTFEQGVEREHRFSIKDVEAVINAPEFFRDGNAYFTGVWIQAEKSEPLEQTKVLRTMSQSEHGMTVEQIAGHMKLPNEKIENALETLTRHDVVIRKDGLWQLTVELMRRWVAQKQGEEL
ncbi:MAG: ATP-binding protein [Desulfobacterales bacterium]|nr:ATP-binding protein [Desulfobacterales bacterium]